MPLRTEAYYRAVATDALERLNVVEPPVPVDALIQAFGIPIRAVSLPSFFVAATVYEDGLPVMIVNWVHPESERRKALAHMFGHVLLVLAGEEDAYPRSVTPHTAAEQVARELLLPKELVVSQARLWFNDHRYLARLFGVGEREMADRMRELGQLRGPAGVAWDF